MKYQPYEYQQHATRHIIDNPGSGLFLEMGLGKTVSTLTAIEQLMFDYLEITKVLVIAPKRVAESVWDAEAEKWDHLQHLTFSKILGSQRQRKEALTRKADIYLINCENVAWLVAQYGSGFPFDMVVIDESSKFKSHQSNRFKALRKVIPVAQRVVILTGTPVPQSLIDLWSQLYLVDQGVRLGKTLTQYREAYFKPDKRNKEVIYSYKLQAHGQEEIYGKIGDICISMKSEDYLQLPEMIERCVPVILPRDVLMQYEEFEREQVLAMQNVEITAVNAAALTNKLLQFANGAVYDREQTWHEVHKEKLFALEEIVDVASGKPVFCAYSYRHDLERLLYHFRNLKPICLKDADDIKRWNDGSVSLMFAHPASASHGLNLQAGGHIAAWFGQVWSLEQRLQFNKRLHRPGQLHNVIIHSLIAEGTIDEDVAKAQVLKEAGQDALMEAVKARFEKYAVKAIF
jgi:SNF2 family DNA or RNA helicase